MPCYHDINFENVEVVGHKAHYRQRLFVDARMSVKKNRTLGMTTWSSQKSTSAYCTSNVLIFKKVIKSRVTLSVFATDEGLWGSRNFFPKYTSQWQKTALVINLVYYKLPCVCSVIDHSEHFKNVPRTSVTHSPNGSCGTFWFLAHFDVICDLSWQHGIYLLNVTVLQCRTYITSVRLHHMALFLRTK